MTGRGEKRPLSGRGVFFWGGRSLEKAKPRKRGPPPSVNGKINFCKNPWKAKKEKSKGTGLFPQDGEKAAGPPNGPSFHFQQVWGPQLKDCPKRSSRPKSKTVEGGPAPARTIQGNSEESQFGGVRCGGKKTKATVKHSNTPPGKPRPTKKKTNKKRKWNGIKKPRKNKIGGGKVKGNFIAALLGDPKKKGGKSGKKKTPSKNGP